MSGNWGYEIILRALLESRNYIQSQSSVVLSPCRAEEREGAMNQSYSCDFPPGIGDSSTTFSIRNATSLSDLFSLYNCSFHGMEEEPPCINPQFFSHTYRIIGTLFQGIVLLVGVLGNCMVVYVVARTKSMHSPTNCYLVSLAIADCIVLIAAVPQEILSYYLVGNQWIWGEYGCAAFIFFQNLGINASSLSLTAFTVERYIAICHPMKAQSVCTVRRAKRIIVVVWIFAVIYCSPWFFALTTTRKLNYFGYKDIVFCTYKLTREQYLGYYFADLFFFYIVPLLLSTVLYSLIARILFDSHRLKSSTCGSSQFNNASTPHTYDSTKTNAARVQVVKMLVLIVVIFAVLWLPYRGMLVYNSFKAFFKREGYRDLWFLMFAKTCVYINSAINPILYNAMSVKFRRAFNRALTCGKSGQFNPSRWPHYCRTNTSYATASTAILPHSAAIFTYDTSPYGGRKGYRGSGKSSMRGRSSSSSPIENIRLSHLSLCPNISVATRPDLAPSTSLLLSPRAAKSSRSCCDYDTVKVIVVDTDDINCSTEDDITQL